MGRHWLLVHNGKRSWGKTFVMTQPFSCCSRRWGCNDYKCIIAIGNETEHLLHCSPFHVAKVDFDAIMVIWIEVECLLRCLSMMPQGMGMQWLLLHNGNRNWDKTFVTKYPFPHCHRQSGCNDYYYIIAKRFEQEHLWCVTLSMFHRGWGCIDYFFTIAIGIEAKHFIWPNPFTLFQEMGKQWLLLHNGKGNWGQTFVMMQPFPYPCRRWGSNE